MRLTTKGRYAVMAMVDLAYYGNPNKPISLHEICTRQKRAINYLEQLFSRLKKHKLVKSIKGPGGGYILAKKAEDISVLSIMDAVGEAVKMTMCPNNSNIGCLSGAKCFTHELWSGLGKQICDYLSSTSLQDICDNVK